MIILSVFTLVFGCDSFNLSVSDFIENATGTTEAEGYSIESLWHSMENEVIAIPPNETTQITVALRNPLSYDLTFSFEGEGSDKAQASLSANKQTAIVTINNPVRTSDHIDRFDLTLNMSANGRPMEPYKLPKMEARYFNTGIEAIAILHLDGPNANKEHEIEALPPPHMRIVIL